MGEWQDTMSAVEFESWMLYCMKKPLPAQRADLCTARQSAQIAGMMGAKNVKLSDFMFDFDGAEGDGSTSTSTGRTMPPEQVSHLLDAAAAQHIENGYGDMIDGDRFDS